MIPKTIHCVWLSGEEKPSVYLNCIQTWKSIMPDYEIKEWSLANLPKEVINHIFVSSAIREKKWAYATDYIRLWVLYYYGGVYMDLDVIVYKPFDIFLSHRAFSSIELNPRFLYKTVNKKEIIGCGIEAAVIGCEKGHPWVKDIMCYYSNIHFINSLKFYMNIIMPRVMTRISKEKYGFRIVPIYQVLKEDIHIYPSDVFSSLYDFNTIGKERNDNEIKRLGDNPIRYAFHICAHGWWESPQLGLIYKIKHILIHIFGKKIIRIMKSHRNDNI